MKKTIKGVLLGAVIYFVLGMANWMVMPWHEPLLKRLPEETLIRDTLKVTTLESGLYMIPSFNDAQGGKLDKKSYADLFSSGPSGFLFYTVSKNTPMGASNLIIEALLAFLISAFCSWILFLGKDQLVYFRSRFLVIISFGVFQWLGSTVMMWNWFHMPGSFALVLLLDTLIVYAGLGFVLAWSVRAA